MKLGGRSVWQVLGLYLAGGWVLLQVVDVLVDNVGLPPRVFTLALVLLAVGFPIALITAVVQGSARDSARIRRIGRRGSARIRWDRTIGLHVEERGARGSRGLGVVGGGGDRLDDPIRRRGGEARGANPAGR